MIRLTEKKMKYFVIFLAAMISITVLLAAEDGAAAKWPEKGKVITLYVAGGAGGAADIPARALLPFLEAELGSKFVVINRPPNQVGTTEYLSKAGTDGYTLLFANSPTTHVAYLDPDRKAAYSRKDFMMVAGVVSGPSGVAVVKGSRFKSLKDLVEAAKANPGKVRATASGPFTLGDFGIVTLEKAAGVKFARMYFDQQGEQRAALLGGHADAEFNGAFEFLPGQKSGEIETLAVFDNKDYKYLPGVKTTEAQGYKAYGGKTTLGLVYKTGTPRGIADVLTAAVKKASAKPEFSATFEKIGMVVTALNAKELSAVWDTNEAMVKALLEDLKKK